MVTNNSVALDLVKGAVAGAVATWFMDQATTWLYERQPAEVTQRENDARGGRSAYGNAAESAAGLVGIGLDDDSRARAASAIHWTMGVGAGMLYAVLRRRQPAAAAGKGLVFGAAWFLAMDELVNTAMGFAPPPQQFPWQTHARGLGGHAAFGLANEVVLEALDRVA